MASMQIRDTDPARDAPALVELLRETEPLATVNVASWLHRERAVPARARLRAFVAEVDGRVVGESWVLRAWFAEGRTLVYVAVREQARRRGIGSALYDAALDHARTLDQTRLSGTFYESPAGLAFAAARGFREARAEQIAVLDPRDVREQPPPGLDLRSARDIDPHDLHLVDETATRDMPQLEQVEAIPYDEWEQHVLAHPLFTLDGTFVAYVDGRPAACSMLIVDRESGRATNMFTGTMPEFRGRGLGLACKLASIHWAAANGVTQMATMNDETNAPMLAINRRLGYRPAGRRVEYVAVLASII
jgi:GNAT superfamily N-acetyltransferase